MSTETSKKETQENPFAGRTYVRAVGRRKSASAVAQLYAGGTGAITVNRKPLDDYFGFFTFSNVARMPLEKTGMVSTFDVNMVVKGGGPNSQAQAVSLAIARALLVHDENLRPILRQNGLVTVDRRVKERKKPGKKRARRSPQWSKR